MKHRHAKSSVWLAIFVSLLATNSLCAEGRIKSSSDSEALPLADCERRYIAEIEHRALTLNKKGFPALASALRGDNPLAFKRFLSKTFKGEVLDLASASGPRTEMFFVRRTATSDGASARKRDVDADEFITYLFGLRRQVDHECKVELALMELAPVERKDMD